MGVEEPVVAAAYQDVMTPAVDYSYLPYATGYGYNVPATHLVQSAPVVAPTVKAVSIQPVVSAAPVPVQQVQPVVSAAPVPVQQVQPVVSPVPADLTNSQFHAQDDIGQYNYGYSSPTSTKQELKTADGVTRGSYSYLDANGVYQTVNYISDALGFKVAATNLPVHHVEGPTAAVQEAVEAVEAEPEVIDAYKGEEVMTPQAQYSYLPYAQNYEYYGAASNSAPAPAVETTYSHVPAAPIVTSVVTPAVTPVAQVVQPVSADGSQYHAQDDLGQYSFGYSNGNSVKQEIRTADGVVRGAYQYVDSDGIVQTVNYIADALGFRVGASNLPVHHVDGASPAEAEEKVEEPVVAAAYQDVMTPAVDYSYLPYATGYGYNVPATH